MNARENKPDLIGLNLDILEAAIDAFKRETKLRAEKGRLEVKVAGRFVDATLQIEGPNRTIEYFVEIKPDITDVAIGKLAHQFAETPGKWLVVARHVPTYLARRMKELHIQFLDTAGNAYLNENPLLVFVHGNKPEQRFAKQKVDQAWGRAGAKTIFALLCNNGLVDAPYREIAAGANVALGTLARVLNDLIQQGFLLDRGIRGRRLQRKKELFDKWADAYALKLRPKTVTGVFTTDKEGFWQQGDLTRYHAFWGGEVAANKMTQFLKPEIVTIYVNKPLNDLVLNFRLHKNAQGNVELRERFWRFETEDQARGLVPPILVYADLMATGEPRNVETARAIYEEHIERHIRED
ncbi:MAG: type IV toxin-antitoxin system AbiEi family antitoxin [Ignavibacteria bacterium]|nr:type IV toxin-antitoxin system AbiEi family antitoxin [Ignavibacteria bacterium]